MYRKEKQTNITIENVNNYRDKSAGYFTFFFQRRTKWRNCKMSTKTPDYQLGWAILDANRQLNSALQTQTL